MKDYSKLTEEEQLKAVSQNGWAITEIKDPSLEVVSMNKLIWET